MSGIGKCCAQINAQPIADRLSEKRLGIPIDDLFLFFSSNSHVEDLSTLHIDELWMVWMNICQSPVFPLSPLYNHSSRWIDGVNGIFSTFCKAFGEIVRMHLCGILLLEIFLNSPTSRLTAREKREISLSEDWSLSERALTSSCSILQVSFYFQFLLLKFGLCKKKKTKIQYRGVSKSWKVISYIIIGARSSLVQDWR